MPRTPPSSKVLLVADRRTAGTTSAAVPVRRFRLARLRLEARASDPVARYEYLKRVYD